jgi:hypothetical protein
MKKFIIQLSFFLIPILLFSFLADIFITKELKKSHVFASGEGSVWNDIFNGKINSEIVIYGSSRAWVQIDPGKISDSLHTTVYNLGIDGHNFWLQYLRHRLLLEYNIRPKLIIYSLDIFTLEKRPDLYNPDQFLPYMLFNKEIEKATISYKGYSSLDYELPFIRYYGKKGAIFHSLKLFLKPKSDSNVRVKGYQGQDKSWNDDFDKAKDKIQYYSAKLDSPSIQLFEKFLQECKNKNIKIIFVYTPEYIEGQKFIKNREEIMGLYSKLSKKYSIPFYDYSNDSISFQKKYFYNAEHLNKTGAELFTNMFIKKLEGKNVLQ